MAKDKAVAPEDLPEDTSAAAPEGSQPAAMAEPETAMPEATAEIQDVPTPPVATETNSADLVTARRPGRLPGEVSMNDIERIQVSAYQDRFRRTGREFGREPVEIMVDAISDTDLQVLLKEPMLNVLLIAKD